MGKIPLQVGEFVTFSKTVGEADVYLFAGITGDLSGNHVNDAYMRETQYGKRIAHGVLSIGFSSTTSTKMVEKTKMTAVSYGYDRIRFIKPIFIGDTITAKYTIEEIDEENMRTVANIEITNESGVLCTAGKHILKFFD